MTQERAAPKESLRKSASRCRRPSRSKGNNLTIFTEKTANLGNLKEGTWENRQNFHLDEDVSRHFRTYKDAPSASKSKEPKYQTQIIRNVLRNLVRKKNSPKRKTKPAAKSKNQDEDKKLTKKPSTKKTGAPGPESVASSKSRKLHKLFTRKNLSLSLENRKTAAAGAKEAQGSRPPGAGGGSGLKHDPSARLPPSADYWSLSRPMTSKNRETSSTLEAKLPTQFSLQNNKKLKINNLPISQKDGFRFSKRGKKLE